MDPDHALSALIDALVDGDTDYAADVFDNLMDWIAGGGFAPRDPRA